MFFKVVAFSCGVLALSLSSCGTEEGSEASNGHEDNDGTDNAVVSPSVGEPQESWLKQFSSWTPVLDGDVGFASKGHGGQKVKSYFNEIALAKIRSENPYPLPKGSVFAKAVLGSFEDEGSSASKVYYMEKQSDNAQDWKYYVANKQGGESLSFGEVEPSQCSGCHDGYQQYDNVLTVKYYLEQKVEL